ncbi:MAG: glycerate kinase [Bacillota bacterium]
MKKKFVLIPDSFKGTMSSGEICDIMENAVKVHFEDAEIVKIPVADGGEGSVDCFLEAMGGEKIYANVKGPYLEDVTAYYGIIENGKTAVIEMAQAAGLPMVGENRDASKTTTFGVGEMMIDAKNKGVKKIIMCLGGSATNDGGAGMLSALGVIFTNPKGENFLPVGGNLNEINKIDIAPLASFTSGLKFLTMCDIDNPLYGKNGAAHIFGGQKCNDQSILDTLDKNLVYYAEKIKEDIGFSDFTYPGGGAAGGMGYAMIAFLQSEMQMGIDAVLDTVGFEEIIKDADVIFTGEGKIDGQSLRGKVVIGVARRAKTLKIPVVAFVGDIGDGVAPAYDEGVTAILSINRIAAPFSQLKLRAKSDMNLTVDNFARGYKTFEEFLKK